MHELVFGGIFLLLIALMVPLLLGRIPPNGWYGFRTPAAFRSTHNWYRINRLAAIWTIVYLAIAGMVCAGLILHGITGPQLGWFGAAALLGLVPVMLVLIIYTEANFAGKPAGKPCETCGYNLTGNVSGTCPECGSPISR
ncbi:MAG TPA: SdpI family protein [Phycisphaerae bacterium]|jgi:hypothetical protein|nr:SdpI family protein [Phycisphaerae bacterium]HOB73487.1 SdpI family protein [Phycisphaerae bacterium]HOJ54095.1 SdpI family protein [Phycisphaerae bacterium]HOL25612.1 SdpI family protein [Phycisphaerae bacterium]HPP22751.1 SdpI family protein [Phycisphaerae bacterium]